MMKLRILSYNIHGAKGRDQIRDYARIGRFLKEQNIDIALIQEFNTLYDDLDTDLCLQQLMSGHFMFSTQAPTLVNANGWLGNAVLSKYRISSEAVLDISMIGREPRNILEVFVETPEGPLHVINTHKGLGYFERSIQMSKLNEYLKKQSQIPLIVGGDVNEWQGRSAALKKLNESLRPLLTEPTFPTYWPLFTLDRFWCRPPNLATDWKTLRTWETRWFSDHFPVLAEINFSKMSP